MKIALDTNIIAYAEGVNGESRKADAMQLISRMPTASIVIPVQTLLELFNLLVRKAGMAREDARLNVEQWLFGYTSVETTSSLMFEAMGLAVRHGLQIFDAMILAAAAGAKCDLLLSEDMHDGFVWNGVTVRNPFEPNSRVWLEDLLNPADRA